MPARKRHRKQPEHPDPVVRFGRALKQQQERERAEQQRIQTEREEARRRAEEAAEHARRLAAANTRLDKAIAEVKRHRGRADVEAEYRAAKADVVELESGERPEWAPSEGDGDDGDDHDATGRTEAHLGQADAGADSSTT